MPSFPKKESDVVQLADAMIKGVANHRGLYPAPPATPEKLRAYLKDFHTACMESQVADRNKQAADKRRHNALQVLIEEIHANLNYAEETTHLDDLKLQLIGWCSPVHHPQEVPGQPESLEARDDGAGCLLLYWLPSKRGGEVVTYHIQRAHRQGEWENIGATRENSALLSTEPRRQKMAYRVLATNSAGKSLPSNIASITL